MRIFCCGLLLIVLGATALAKSPRNPGPVKTEVVQRDGRYLLLRDGQPYQVRGAGMERGDLNEFAARGGNSLRNWSTHNARRLLDAAHALGLTVSLCLNIARERHGFDYDDPAAVARQFEEARAEVLKYRDHPALLTWIIGNELNHDYKNPKVYDAVNELSKMIHKLDPNHPTTSTTAGFGTELAWVLNERAPDLDFIGIQFYGGLINLPRYIRQAKFQRPIMVTEWGAIGHWEVPTSHWGAPIEQTSSEKAATYRMMYDTVISKLAPHGIGNYVFLWGQKQERTGTWYGLFMDSGESTEVVDLMQEIWTGEKPANRAPRLSPPRLNRRRSHDGPKLRAGREYTAEVKASDPDGDPLRYRWEVRVESAATEVGGDAELTPPLVPGVVDGADSPRITLKAPARPGAYRLFVYVYDGQGHAAHANIPFLVRSGGRIGRYR